MSEQGRRGARVREVAASFAQLVALGIVGPVACGLLLGAVGVSIGLIPVVGLGLVLLAGLVYVLFGVAWLETGRVEGLSRLGLTALRPRRRAAPGFSGLLRTVGAQAIDAAMWRALASAAIGVLLGVAVLALLEGALAGVLLAISPLVPTVATAGAVVVRGFPPGWASAGGVLITLLCLALAVAVALLHGLISRALLVPSREGQLAEEVRLRTEQREGAVRAAGVERTRIERDLHDGVQPRLVSIGMTLGLAQRRMDDDPEAARALLTEAHESTQAAITELRQLARGIHPSVLETRGLDAAIGAVAARFALPVEVDVRLAERCSREAESAVYFAVSEALTNVAKHAAATRARVVIRRDGDALRARIEDDGAGGAVVVPGGGLDGVTNRVLAVGGSVRIDSPAGGPTTMEVTVPCAS